MQAFPRVARAARNIQPHHRLFALVRPRARRIGRPKQRHQRPPQRRGNVHRATVVANCELRSRVHRQAGKLAFGIKNVKVNAEVWIALAVQQSLLDGVCLNAI